MNGAVHGDAIATASTPDANELTCRFACDHDATPLGTSAPNSKTPDRFNAITKNRIASDATTAGDCSWKPQPSSSPAERRPASATPSAANASTTPPANAIAS